jgi:hypothetical protein
MVLQEVSTSVGSALHLVRRVVEHVSQRHQVLVAPDRQRTGVHQRNCPCVRLLAEFQGHRYQQLESSLKLVQRKRPPKPYQQHAVVSLDLRCHQCQCILYYSTGIFKGSLNFTTALTGLRDGHGVLTAQLDPEKALRPAAEDEHMGGRTQANQPETPLILGPPGGTGQGRRVEGPAARTATEGIRDEVNVKT